MISLLTNHHTYVKAAPSLMLTMTLLMIMKVPMNPSTTTKRMTTPKTTETNRLTKLNPQIMKGVTTYPHLKYVTVFPR